MNKNRKVGIVGIIITGIILIVLVILSNIDTIKFVKLENIFNKLVMPVQNGMTYLKNKIQGNSTFFENIDNLKLENEMLKKENAELKEQLQELSIIKAENATLREYADITDKYIEYNTVPAYVINKDISNLSYIIVINVGKDDGIKENMPVISGDGLVGYIISASDKTAKVQTIVDPATNVSGITASSRDIVVTKGILNSDSTVKMTYIPTDTELVLGDNIETSGMGGIYPKGILIGKIKEIIQTKNITDRYAIIETAVNFSKLETVLVIKDYK